MPQKLLTENLYFSFGQVLIFDASEKLPGCRWTRTHVSQGFARRESVLCLRTLEEFGEAEVGYETSSLPEPGRFTRLISVPFFASDGRVNVRGPEENSSLIIELPSGYYRLFAGQNRGNSNKLSLTLFFERLSEPAEHSAVIIADDLLAVPSVLIETAETAGSKRLKPGDKRTVAAGWSD